MSILTKINGARDTAQLVAPLKDGQRVYFTTAELGCRCAVCQGKGKLAAGFSTDLLTIRLAWNKPMFVTSCCRCISHNDAVGGAKGSYHIYETEIGACAIDILMKDSILRADLVELALKLGWRVGINRQFLHIDKAAKYYPAFEERKIFLY